MHVFHCQDDGTMEELRPPLTLTCRKGTDIPVGLSTAVQSVVIDNVAYVYGNATGVVNVDILIKLDLQQNQWKEPIRTPMKNVSLISHANQLLLVRGRYILESEKFNCPYPPMSASHPSTTAVFFSNCIIVVGGYDYQTGLPISSVEILRLPSKKWYSAESLPNLRASAKATLIGSTLFVMGGWDHTRSATKVVYKVDLTQLINKAIHEQTTTILWQTIQDAPLKQSAPLGFRGSLFAVGGTDASDEPNTSIYLYQSDSNEWVKVGDLDTPRWNCACSVLPGGEIIVVGGRPPSSTTTVELLSISTPH